MNLSTLQHPGSLQLGMAALQPALLTTSAFPSMLRRRQRDQEHLPGA